MRWPRRLLGRNVLIMALAVLAGQLLAAWLMMALVLRPQAARMAQVTAAMTEAVGQSLARMTPLERQALIARFNAEDQVVIRPGDDPPAQVFRAPTPVEREFLRAMAIRFNHGAPLARLTDGDSRLWVRLQLAGGDWWVSVTPPGLHASRLSLWIALATAALVAIVGSLLVQRHIDRPLRRLVTAVDAFDPGPVAPGSGRRLDEDGPEELAAVARAFNRMTDRVAAQEAERSLMLAAVSHDMRTPLTRLRLALELLRGADRDLLEGAGRQVDRIESMLSQFLDFARGFEAEPPVTSDVAAVLAGAAIDAGFDGDGDGLVLDVAAGLCAELRPAAATRAVANLLANARRHGAGPYEARAWCRDGRLAIGVIDHGKGFDPARVADLSRPFSRGDSARSGDGAGLGLAIVARIAAAHGGALEFRRDADTFEALLVLGPCDD
jgi:two-component system osmolarity sensor histidine kinase EnvZ